MPDIGAGGPTFDLVVAGGTVYDGSGAPPTCADIGLLGDRIAAIGELRGAGARQTIDATGFAVCPGFIDVHSHSDAYLLIEPSAPSKIFQGVTTEIVGNCGASAAPRRARCRLPVDWQALLGPVRWPSVAAYREQLAEARPALNVAMLVGHNNLRASVMGYEDRRANAGDRAEMADLLERAMDEGALGLSSGLVYSPGLFADTDEVRGLARVVARRNGLYTSHMRSEGPRLLEAIDEVLDVSRATGVRAEISHLKTSGPAHWDKLDAALNKLRNAQQEGIEVAADRYPYCASCTDLDILLPDWAAAGERPEILGRLRDPATRRKLRAEILASRDEGYWDRVMIGSTGHPDNRVFQGRPLREAATALGMEPVDAVLHLIDTDELRTGGIFFGMNEENMWRILAEPWVMIGSDGSLRAPEGPLGQDHPHPRHYGTFPRFLRAALDGKTVPVEEAIRKMTSLPADHFRLRGRGRVALGAWADLLVFDPAAVRETATYAEPHQLAEGIHTVIVNGTICLKNGRPTGDRSGLFLEPGR